MTRAGSADTRCTSVDPMGERGTLPPRLAAVVDAFGGAAVPSGETTYEEIAELQDEAGGVL